MKIDRRSTDTRQRLIDTTLDLIDSDGWHAVTLGGVAHACGVTTPACYKHFPSKTSLFEAAAHQLSASLGQRADALIQDDPIESLTPREREVLALMAEGCTNAAIAARLVVTEGAVEKHTQRIFAKLGLLPDAAVHRRVKAVLALLSS